MDELVLVGGLLVAFVNGANDNFKGVATLHGCGALSYRRAIVYGTAATALGGIVSLFAARALATAFSGKGLVPDAVLDDSFLAAVAIGAAATVLLATRLGFPVSTTHALLGGLAGAGWTAAGSELDLAALGGTFALPLGFGPLVAIGLAWVGLRGWRRWRTRSGRAGPGSPAPGDASSGSRSLHGLHLLSGGFVSFARGLNDTPKIFGLLAGASIVPPAVAVLLITAFMAAGGLLAARRVAHTLSQRITPMSPEEGLVGNAATAALVIGASRLGFPVSTTHVSTGSIFGIGVDSGGLRWRAAGEIAAAWVITLPLAALLSASACWALL
jgi:PiT family inorganic phosphate transporter